jgi:hypothetical protein
MKPVQITGHVNKDGKLEINPLPAFPPGEDLRILIMEPAGMAALEKMIDLVASIEITDPEFLEQLEALDEALWDMQFANSQDALKKLAGQAYEEYQRGEIVELDLDELNRKDP